MTDPEYLLRLKDERIDELIKERDSAVQRAERAEQERDAYRKAKCENDERFMIERDSALTDVSKWKERWRHLHAEDVAWGRLTEVFKVEGMQNAAGVVDDIEKKWSATLAELEKMSSVVAVLRHRPSDLGTRFPTFEQIIVQLLTKIDTHE